MSYITFVLIIIYRLLIFDTGQIRMPVGSLHQNWHDPPNPVNYLCRISCTIKRKGFLPFVSTLVVIFLAKSLSPLEKYLRQN